MASQAWRWVNSYSGLRGSLVSLALGALLAVGGCSSWNLPDNPLEGKPPPDLEILRAQPDPAEPNAKYVRIEGVWMNLRTGVHGADFELRNVAINGDQLTGIFRFGATHRLVCAFEVPVSGNFKDHVIRVETNLPCESVPLRANINVVNWRGFYTAGARGHGWLLVKRVTLPDH